MTGAAFRGQGASAGAALLGALVLSFCATALAQTTCKRYQQFEGLWDGTIANEQIERRYPQPHLAVLEDFNPDHRRLNIVYQGSNYAVTWNMVEGQSVPSLRETAQIAEDTDGYCQQVRRQSKLAPMLPGIRINIDGAYDNGSVPVRFATKMCCFAYQPQAITCTAATHYETSAGDAYGRDEVKPWYDGLWYVTMKRPPRPNDCQSQYTDRYPQQLPGETPPKQREPNGSIGSDSNRYPQQPPGEIPPQQRGLDGSIGSDSGF